MLDRLLQSPAVPIGFVVFVIVLFFVYLTNRERTHIQRMKGGARFQPDWSRTRRGRTRRRRRGRMRSGEFRPDWGSTRVDWRSGDEQEEPTEPESPENPENPKSPDPGEGGQPRGRGQDRKGPEPPRGPHRPGKE